MGWVVTYRKQRKDLGRSNLVRGHGLGTEGVILDWLFGRTVTHPNGLTEHTAEFTTAISSTDPSLPSKQPEL